MKLPSEWEMKTLGELGTCHIGLTYKPDNVVPEGGTLVLRSSNIQQSRLVFDDNVFVNMDVPSKLKVCYGDILICVRNGSRSLIGKSAVIEREHAIENLTFGAFMSVYRTDHHDYVRHLFHSDMYYRQIRSNLGATINQITNKNLNNFTFPFPKSSAERNKISEVLSTIDKKIDLIDQKIAETEKLKTGLMQKLFSEGIGVQDENGNWQPHTEFRTTSIGQVPKTWQDAQIGDYVSELVSGVSVNSYDKQKTENEIGVLKTSAVIGGNFYPEFHKTVKPEDIARAKTTVKENTLVISRMNTPSLVGEFGYVSKDYNDLYLPDRLWMTVPTSKPHDVKALSYLMQHYPVKKSIKELATGTSNSMKNISKGKFLAVYVPHIPYEEQMMIREILSTVDIKLELLNKQKAETQQLKKGLMQKLLTGEWRVPVEETEAA
ncbi:restriction endonuclease subunit S [Vibrio parahaemolyticus]|nr:restriction endonuclease subunit S [Vibrio alginolyticus]EHA1122082.1 restriction endonuclease subunit S [Vibrio alginolyticus]EHA1123339.1 restriction endonuclease subunit S [Vibrio alginolyticus]MDG2641592.1 restriction endonuclease subunit S [Vibrio parahaemolyticus]